MTSNSKLMTQKAHETEKDKKVVTQNNKQKNAGLDKPVLKK